MKNNYFSKDDDMRPFIVKKMNLPPASTNHTENKNIDQKSRHTTTENRNPLTEEHVYEVPLKKKKHTFKVVKPFILSVVSAIAIGVLLGFIVLKMSSGGTDVASVHPSSQPLTSEGNVADNSESDVQENEETIQVKELGAYVLQAGVYSEKENTEEIASTLQGQGYPVTIWEEDNQYYVFTHVFPTEEEAKDAAGQLEKSELETYAKPWATQEKSIEMTKEEEVFLQTFVKIWEETVEKYPTGETDFIQLWEQLGAEIPTDSMNVEDLVTYITAEITEAEAAIDMEQILLDTWYMYSKLGDL